MGTRSSGTSEEEFASDLAETASTDWVMITGVCIAEGIGGSSEEISAVATCKGGSSRDFLRPETFGSDGHSSLMDSVVSVSTLDDASPLLPDRIGMFKDDRPDSFEELSGIDPSKLAIVPAGFGPCFSCDQNPVTPEIKRIC